MNRRLLDVCNIIVEYNGFDPASNSTATDWDPIAAFALNLVQYLEYLIYPLLVMEMHYAKVNVVNLALYVTASIRPICKLNCNSPVAKDCCGIPTLEVTKPCDSNELFNWVDNPLISSIDNLRLI